jgi:hypothetical protein
VKEKLLHVLFGWWEIVGKVKAKLKLESLSSSITSSQGRKRKERMH